MHVTIDIRKTTRMIKRQEERAIKIKLLLVTVDSHDVGVADSGAVWQVSFQADGLLGLKHLGLVDHMVLLG